MSSVDPLSALKIQPASMQDRTSGSIQGRKYQILTQESSIETYLQQVTLRCASGKHKWHKTMSEIFKSPDKRILCQVTLNNMPENQTLPIEPSEFLEMLNNAARYPGEILYNGEICYFSRQDLHSKKINLLNVKSDPFFSDSRIAMFQSKDIVTGEQLIVERPLDRLAHKHKLIAKDGTVKERKISQAEYVNYYRKRLIKIHQELQELGSSGVGLEPLPLATSDSGEAVTSDGADILTIFEKITEKETKVRVALIAFDQLLRGLAQLHELGYSGCNIKVTKMIGNKNLTYFYLKAFSSAFCRNEPLSFEIIMSRAYFPIIDNNNKIRIEREKGSKEEYFNCLTAVDVFALMTSFYTSYLQEFPFFFQNGNDFPQFFNPPLNYVAKLREAGFSQLARLVASGLSQFPSNRPSSQKLLATWEGILYPEKATHMTYLDRLFYCCTMRSGDIQEMMELSEHIWTRNKQQLYQNLVDSIFFQSNQTFPCTPLEILKILYYFTNETPERELFSNDGLIFWYVHTEEGMKKIRIVVKGIPANRAMTKGHFSEICEAYLPDDGKPLLFRLPKRSKKIKSFVEEIRNREEIDRKIKAAGGDGVGLQSLHVTRNLEGLYAGYTLQERFGCDLVEAGSTLKILSTNPSLGKQAVGTLIWAVYQLHVMAQVAPCDIKPDNVLFDGETVRLNDFSTPTLTQLYVDPREAKVGATFEESCKIDIRALGITIILMLLGELPFERENDRIVIDEDNFAKVVTKLTELGFGDLIPLLTSMLQTEPGARSSIEQLWEDFQQIKIDI